MTNQRTVLVGVDTHANTHHAAVLDAGTGELLADRQFRADRAGYAALAEFALAHGEPVRFGVEGTNSYGAGLARHLRQNGFDVAEIIRPNRAARRLRGKSDPLDAVAAAREALAHDDLPAPKHANGPVESIRVLHLVRDSAVQARANVLRQIKAVLVTAPAAQREKLARHTGKALLDALRRVRPGEVLAGTEAATMIALRHLALRHQGLTEEIDEATDKLRALVQATSPALLVAKGIGIVTAAQLLVTAGDNPERIKNEAAFAALCGTSPLPASSGKTTRHRLNRGGDRQANAALHRIALTRMNSEPRTRAYIQKRTSEGKGTKEALRCLKRAIAREVYRLLTNPPTTPATEDLRPARLQRAITLQTVANHFGVQPARISEIERGKLHDTALTTAYRQWLNAV
jgi:transposase